MMLGQEKQEAAFIGALASGRMAHAWLLTGIKGIGKAGFARRAATFLLADGVVRARAGAHTLDIDHDVTASRLVESDGHPDFFWLKREVPYEKRPKDGGPGKPEDRARNITIGQVRELNRHTHMRPSMAEWRVIVIDSIDVLERSAANALLKSLEEPPPNTLFLLVCHEPGRLLPTIRSRCRTLHFDAPGAAVGARLINDGSLSDTAVERIVAVAGGSPGRARDLKAGKLDTVYPVLERIARDGDRDNRGRVELAQIIGGKGGELAISAMLEAALAISAESARRSEGARRATALDVRDRIAGIAALAISWSEAPAMVAYAVADALAGLAAEAAVPAR